jgi:folate-binding protein YgfZ
MNKLISEILENGKGLYLDEGLLLLRVSGEDKNKFLQGQLTNDVESLINEEYLLASYCTHQGKVIVNMQLIADGDDVIIILPKNLSEYFIEKISKYILMSKVKFDIVSGAAVLSILGDEALSINKKYNVLSSGHYKKIDDNNIVINMSTPLIPQSKCVLMNPGHQIEIACSEKDKPNTCLIDLFSLVTRLQVENIEKYIPQVLNADRLNTVSYKKGCYTGQEVVARTHYLGNVKKHMYLVNIYSSKIKEKNIINNDGESVGEIIGKTYEYNNKILTHCILRDSCDFNELYLGKIKLN